jgi:hypothetical protein
VRSALIRPAFPFATMADFLRQLARMVREAGPIRDVGTIAYCDDGESLVGLPEEIVDLRCASCVLLSVYVATLGHQAGRRMDLCASALGSCRARVDPRGRAEA